MEIDNIESIAKDIDIPLEELRIYILLKSFPDNPENVPPQILSRIFQNIDKNLGVIVRYPGHGREYIYDPETRNKVLVSSICEAYLLQESENKLDDSILICPEGAAIIKQKIKNIFDRDNKPEYFCGYPCYFLGEFLKDKFPPVRMYRLNLKSLFDDIVKEYEKRYKDIDKIYKKINDISSEFLKTIFKKNSPPENLYG